jgi:type I restriction enzyme M protein
MKISAPRSTRSLARSSSTISPASPPRWRRASPNGANGDDDEESDDGLPDEASAKSGAPARKGLPEKKKPKLLDARTWERDARLVETAAALRQELGGDLFEDHNLFRDRVDEALKQLDLKLSAADLKLILRTVSWRVETAPPVIDKLLKEEPDTMHGRYPISVLGQSQIGNRKSKIQSVSFEPDPDLRDTEQIPLTEPASEWRDGIEAFVQHEVLPYAQDAWVDEPKTKIGYEISFTRHFYKPAPMRTLAEIQADIRALEAETEDLIAEIAGAG